MRLLEFHGTKSITYLNPMHVTHVGYVRDGNGKAHVEIGVVNDGGNHYLTPSVDETEATRIQRTIADAMRQCDVDGRSEGRGEDVAECPYGGNDKGAR